MRTLLQTKTHFPDKHSRQGFSRPSWKINEELHKWNKKISRKSWDAEGWLVAHPPRGAIKSSHVSRITIWRTPLKVPAQATHTSYRQVSCAPDEEQRHLASQRQCYQTLSPLQTNRSHSINELTAARLSFLASAATLKRRHPIKSSVNPSSDICSQRRALHLDWLASISRVPSRKQIWCAGWNILRKESLVKPPRWPRLTCVMGFWAPGDTRWGLHPFYRDGRLGACVLVLSPSPRYDGTATVLFVQLESQQLGGAYCIKRNFSNFST